MCIMACKPLVITGRHTVSESATSLASRWKSCVCGWFPVPVWSGLRAIPGVQRLWEGELLLTGQHRDDQAETLLFRLLRGAGVRGLAAMPDVRSMGRGSLVRPLLEVSRAELEDYARANGLAWVEDPSNQQLEYSRNFLRRQVLLCYSSAGLGRRPTWRVPPRLWPRRSTCSTSLRSRISPRRRLAAIADG